MEGESGAASAAAALYLWGRGVGRALVGAGVLTTIWEEDRGRGDATNQLFEILQLCLNADGADGEKLALLAQALLEMDAWIKLSTRGS